MFGDIEITLLFGFVVFVIATLALKGDAVVWRLPSYRRFKDTVFKLERTCVNRIKGSAKPDVTLELVGIYCIGDIFQTDAPPAGNKIRIKDCFGAIFLKEESIDDVLGIVKWNAWVVLIVALFGALVDLNIEPDAGYQILNAEAWHKIPVLANLMLKHHLVLFAELFTILYWLINLGHNTLLLRRLNRSLKGVL